jgi:membrane protein YqaA with SNARE-associated domain
MSIAVAYTVFDSLFREFSTVKKYLLTLIVVGGFFGYYFQNYFTDPKYLYKTEEINQWKTLSAYMEEQQNPNLSTIEVANNINLKKALTFNQNHGGKAIVLARFVPVIRTFAPIVAGIGTMHYRRFVAFNVIGGFLWAVGVSLAGYFLAAIIGPENIDKYLLPIIILIVLISAAPAIYHILKDEDSRASLFKTAQKLLGRQPKAVTSSAKPGVESGD